VRLPENAVEEILSASKSYLARPWLLAIVIATDVPARGLIAWSLAAEHTTPGRTPARQG